MSTLDIVTVTFDSADVIDTCLEAVAALPQRPTVIVVDNRSSDDTRELAKRKGHAVVDAGANLGYAAAANLGARKGRADVLCFLNPDCEITAAVVEQAFATFAADDRCCAVPTYRHSDGSIVPGRQPGYSRRKLLGDIVETAGAPQWTARLKRRGTHHDERWHWPLGACLFVPRSLFDELGGFDERYFVYMEDVRFGLDLCRAGGRVMALDSTLEHLGGQGSALSNEQRIRLLDDARLRFAADRYGRVFALSLRMARSAARLSARLAKARRR